MIGRQFVFEFVNATYHGRSTVVIAPDFQRLPGFQADADINRLHGSRQISAGGMTSPPATLCHKRLLSERRHRISTIAEFFDIVIVVEWEPEN